VDEKEHTVAQWKGLFAVDLLRAACLDRQMLTAVSRGGWGDDFQQYRGSVVSDGEGLNCLWA